MEKNRKEGELQVRESNEAGKQLMSNMGSEKFYPLSCSNEGSETVKGKELHILPVPDDWEFNDLLSNIAKEMTKEDLEDMKSRVKGDGGIRRKALDTIVNAHELFDLLQRYQFINRDNLLMLQALLFRMHRTELFEQAVKYAQSTGNVVHFTKPPPEPPNGFRYVQIHIQGPNFNEYNRSSLDALRAVAARLMFVKPELVVIAGIEPSSSILITLMIPDAFVEYMRQGAEKSECIKEWTYFGVDYIQIENTKYSIPDSGKLGTEETEVQQKLKSLFQQNEDMKQKLDEQDYEILMLNRTIQELKEDESMHWKTDTDTQRQEKRAQVVCINLPGDNNIQKQSGDDGNNQLDVNDLTTTPSTAANSLFLSRVVHT